MLMRERKCERNDITGETSGLFWFNLIAISVLLACLISVMSTAFTLLLFFFLFFVFFTNLAEFLFCLSVDPHEGHLIHSRGFFIHITHCFGFTG